MLPDRIALYRLLHIGNPGDVDFYRRLCAEADTVLEIGGGWGRISAALAADGRQVCALEIDPEMAAAARAHAAEQGVADRITQVIGDMRAFDLGRRFDRIIIPYSGLFCLADDAEVVAALSAMARHLAPDGVIAFDGYQIVDPDNIEGGDDFEWLCALDHQGCPIQVFELDAHDPVAHRWTIRYRFEADPPGGPRETWLQVLHHHYVLREDLADLLHAAGLTLLGIWGDFEGGPADDEADHLVVVAGLPEPD